MLVPVVALLVLLATSFQPDVPVQSSLPPTIADKQAAQLVTDAAAFQEQFPNRRTGSSDSIDAAQWMRDRFREIGLPAETVSSTTNDPATGTSESLFNVEATLRGRTRELVVVYAHRDSADAARGSDAVGQVALLAVAKELAATRDLRRTYLFVSTDGATLNGGGARMLAERLARRGAVTAIIGIDRVGGDGQLRVDASPSGPHAPPLGLVQAATGSVDAEGGDPSTGSVLSQIARLAAPVTLREHGQLLAQGLPALTITAGDDQLRASGDTKPTTASVGAGVRSVQRLIGTIEQLDQMQSAGKTWVASDQRVYRGWALKILIASLLIPVWVAAVDMLVRHRRGWNLALAIGTAARAMLAGVAAITALWLLGWIGLLPASTDRPPNPGALDDVHVFAMVVWVLVVTAAWLLARGPDWRRQRLASRSSAIGPDTPELVVTLVGLVVVSVLSLAVSPYAVLFIAPALHLWICIPSWRVVFSPARATAIWCAGFVGPVLAMLAVAARADSGLGTGWFAVQLLQTRTVPPMLALLIGAGGGLCLLLLLAARGRVAHPALPVLRARWIALYDGEIRGSELVPSALRSWGRTVGQQLRRLHIPRGSGTRTRVRRMVSTGSSRARTRTRTRGSQPEAAAPMTAAERARARAAERTAGSRRVKS